MKYKIHCDQIDTLSKYYPEACCSLNYTTPYSLCLALILAAQCTDERVNKTTPVLFKKYPEIIDIYNSKLEDIEKIVKSCGFYRNKAKNIKLLTEKLVKEYNSIVPNTMAELLTLSGIGRKSANVILQECFNKLEGIVVDTHVTRISNLIGLSASKNPIIIEQDIMKKLPKKYWNNVNHVLVFHGRKICIARRPQCDICPIKDLCKSNTKA